MRAAKLRFAATLLALDKAMKVAARRYPAFAGRLKEKDLSAQIKLRDDSQGRCFFIRDGKVSSRSGMQPAADIMIAFNDAEVAVRLLRPDRSQLQFIHAVKNFQVLTEGPDELTIWFSETLSLLMTAGAEYGVDCGKGITRYTSNTNGGPVFVYVEGVVQGLEFGRHRRLRDTGNVNAIEGREVAEHAAGGERDLAHEGGLVGEGVGGGDRGIERPQQPGGIEDRFRQLAGAFALRFGIG